MQDYRLQLIQDLELILLSTETAQTTTIIVDKFIQKLGNYEILERCTDIVPLSDFNEKILKRYCACLLIDGKSEKTIKQYNRSIQKFIDFIGKDINEVGVYDIRYFLACEKQRGISNRTLENTRANLSAYFQWLTLEEIIPKNPCLNIKPIKYTEEVRLPFSDVEIDSLRSACTKVRDRAIIELLLSSGIRVSELSGLDVRDIDFVNLQIHVRHGKGNKERIVYFNDVTKFHLERYLCERKERGASVFYNDNHTRLENNGIRYVLNQIANRAGVNNVHPHRFRRTFATRLAGRGMSVQEIQKLLGHANINTTMTYIYTDNNLIYNSYVKLIS